MGDGGEGAGGQGVGEGEVLRGGVGGGVGEVRGGVRRLDAKPGERWDGAGEGESGVVGEVDAIGSKGEGVVGVAEFLWRRTADSTWA